MRKRLQSRLIIVVVLLFAVSHFAYSQSGKAHTKPVHTAVQRQQPKGMNTFRTWSGRIIVLKETHPDGESLSDLIISTRGFKDNTLIKLTGIDPVYAFYLADLDGNGWQELYVITMGTGSGAYGTVYAYKSDNDARLVPLKIAELSQADMAKGALFEGYMGHDDISVKGKNLLRSFPLYKDNDPNCCPTGGSRTLKYVLRGDSLVLSAADAGISVNDSTELTSLVRNVYQWHITKDTSGLFTYKLRSASDSIFTGVDWNAYENKVEIMKRAGFFCDEFFAAYRAVVSGIDSSIKQADVEWRNIKDGIPLWDTDVDDWCICQDYPNNYWKFITLRNIHISGEAAAFIWTWGNRNGMKANSYAMKAKKENGTWMISYIEGFSNYKTVTEYNKEMQGIGK